MTLRGATLSIVRDAIETGQALAGTEATSSPIRGFAGELDGQIVRDVLGREPLFVECESEGVSAWSFDPSDLDDPELFPAGYVRSRTTSERIWTLPDVEPIDPDAATEELHSALTAALDDLPDDPPVAFSGGVDSGIVATKSDGPLYVAGFPDSHDVDAAREGADLLGRELRVVDLDHDAVRRAAVAVSEATGRTNAMDVSIAIPLYLTAKQVAADGFDRLAIGQGADELFGGYAKIARAPDDPRVDAETVLGARDEVLQTLPDQLARDVLAIRAAGVEPVAPLLDDRVVAAALRLPEALLVDDERRKVGLRTTAATCLPSSIANRDKKALQYGSLVSRELDRLARRAGYKRRMDDHVTKYVEALVADASDS